MSRLLQLFSFIFFFFSLSLSAVNKEPLSVRYGAITADKLHEEFKERLSLSESKTGLIGYIDFFSSNAINDSTYIYIQSALEFFKSNKVAFIIVRINAEKGEIFPTLKIAELFQKFDFNEKIPFIAYVDNLAIGCGAIIAYSCRFIAINENSYIGGESPDKNVKSSLLPEAYKPYILNEFASLAASYGRDPLLAQGMVDLNMILVERNREPVVLSSMLDVVYDTANPDVILSADKDYLTLNADQLLKYNVADFCIESKVWPFTSGENFGKSPLSQEPYLFLYNNYIVKNYFNAFFGLLLFLSYPLISGVLIFSVISLFYLQIRLSKFSIYSILLILFSSLTALSAYGLRSASWIECSFLFIGLVIVVLDHFLLGGTNIFGSFGIALLIVSLFMVMIPGFEKVGLLDLDSLVFSFKSIQNRLIALSAGLFLSLVFISFYKRSQVHKKGFSNIEKKETKENALEKGYQFTSSKSLPQIGEEGFAHSSLRPLGKVMIKDLIYDAESKDQEQILRKTTVVVVGYNQTRIVVKPK